MATVSATRFVFETNSPDETVSVGKKVGALLRAGDIVAYKGGLGVGKTTFTHGLALGMGLRDEVSSPTFAIVNEYAREGLPSLYHFDMYRIGDAEELESIGFYDYLDGGGVIAIEWSENISDLLPIGAITIEFERTGEDSRRITISGDDRFDGIGN